MFNTLVYIPTILAYTFIVLLLVILSFIVIYVTHKIYTTIYDNLPVAQLSSKTCISNDFEAVSSDVIKVGSKVEGRKSKTALRVIVNLEPCYLAYMVFESKFCSSSNLCQKYLCKMLSSIPPDSQVAQLSDNDDDVDDKPKPNILFKYFDNLASIPTSRDLQKCDQLRATF